MAKNFDWLAPEIRAHLSQPTVPLPVAGQVLGLKGKNSPYDAAAVGEIETLKFGRRLVVPTAWLRKKLQLDVD